jgi:hypothetical protein
VRVIARTWSRLRLDWEMGLHRLPFFTQKVAVMLLGALVATLALLGGVASLVGPPGADGPDHLVPGSTGGSPPVTTRPAPGQAGGQGAEQRQGRDRPRRRPRQGPGGRPRLRPHSARSRGPGQGGRGHGGRAADHHRADHHHRPRWPAAAGRRRQLGRLNAAALTGALR